MRLPEEHTPRLAQGQFNFISIKDEKPCFHLSAGQHNLGEGDLVEINFRQDKFQYKKFHYVGKYIDAPGYEEFSIQDMLMLSEKELEQLGLNEHVRTKISGTWSTVNVHELSIINCHNVVLKQSSKGLKQPENYIRALYTIQEIRSFRSGTPPRICDEAYLLEGLKLPKEQLSGVDLDDVDELNNLVGNIHKSYVNFDHRIVQFSDNYIITHEEFETYCFRFLCLFLMEKAIPEVDEFLNYHLRKHADSKKFSQKLEDYFLELCDHQTVRENLKVKVKYWIASDKLSQIGTVSVKQDINKTRQVIDNEFRNKKSKLFNSDKDYEFFAGLLTDYFEHKELVIPDRQIRLKRGSKTDIARSCKELHKNLSEKTLRSDTKYFSILRVLSVFSDDSDVTIYNALTK